MEKDVKNQNASPLSARDEALLNQKAALTTILLKLAEFAQVNTRNQLKIHEEVEATAVALANLMNAQSTAALVNFHTIFKKEVMRILNESVNESGRAIIESFKTATLTR